MEETVSNTSCIYVYLAPSLPPFSSLPPTPSSLSLSLSLPLSCPLFLGRRLFEDDHPLEIALDASCSHRNSKLVLRDNTYSTIQWDAFTLPELTNFIQILQREEEIYAGKVRQFECPLSSNILNVKCDAYRIAGNFRGRKLSRIGRKGAFRGENFCGMLKLVA